MRFVITSHFIHKQMIRQNVKIKRSNNIFAITSIISKTTEQIDSYSSSMRTTIIITTAYICHRFKHYMSNSSNKKTQFKSRQMLKYSQSNYAQSKRFSCIFNSRRADCLFQQNNQNITTQNTSQKSTRLKIKCIYASRTSNRFDHQKSSITNITNRTK